MGKSSVSEDVIICNLCKVEKKSGPECVKCRRTYHNGCAMKIEGLKVVKKNQILCCEEIEVKAVEDIIPTSIDRTTFAELLNVYKQQTMVAIEQLKSDMSSKMVKLEEIIKDLSNKLNVKKSYANSAKNGNVGSSYSDSRASGNSSGHSRETDRPEIANVRRQNVINKQSNSSNENTDTMNRNDNTNHISLKQVNQAVENALHVKGDYHEAKPRRGKRSEKNRNVLVGTAINDEDDLLTAAPAPNKRVWVYLGKCGKNVSEENINSYIKKRCADIGEVNIKCLADYQQKSFVVSAPFTYFDTLMSETFWPSGIVLRRYFLARQFNNRHIQENVEDQNFQMETSNQQKT